MSLYDVPGDIPLIYVTGGAQGATALNSVVGDALPDLLKDAVVIHQCGPQSGNGDYARLIERREKLEQWARYRYFPVERVGDELAHVYATATVVIGRAGAGTIAELATLGVPSILVPLPGADEQLRNARVLEQANGAIVLPQEELTPTTLVENVRSIISDDSLRNAMRDGARSVAPEDPAARICDALLELSGRS
jgi:UDP-N-acetylglucosamine--N-acetylmuramyl-(pentapeptide) pyrophosphoryl-undecaprenol N-acetylglucosamine transferase